MSDTAFEEGEKKGELSKALKIAKGMLAEKLPVELIVKLTGLTLTEVESMKNEGTHVTKIF